MSFAPGESNYPDIVFDGEAFVVGWWDMRGSRSSVYTVRIGSDGRQLSEVAKLSGDGSAKHHEMVRDGDGIQAVWTEEDKVLSTRLGLHAPKVEVLSENGAMPAAGPWGAAAWVDSGRLFFKSDGMTAEATYKKAPKPALVASGGILDPKIAYNGVFYAVTWSESGGEGRFIAMRRVSPEGRLLGEEVKVSSTKGISRKPAIAWTERGFALAWTTSSDENDKAERLRAFFAVVPDAADAPLFTRQLDFNGSADQVALAAAGEEYALGWVGSQTGRGSAVYMQRLDLDGNPLEDVLKISDGSPFACSRPSMAWDGGGYALVWHDDREQVESEVYFAYASCGNAPSRTRAEGDIDADASVQDEAPPSALPGAPALKDVF